MKITRVTEEEISEFNTLLSDIEWLSKEFSSGKDLSEIDLDDYEVLSNLSKDDAELFLKSVCEKIACSPFKRILFNCMTLLDNCADPSSDTLEFNPDIKAGLELLDKQRKDEFIRDCISTGKCVESRFKLSNEQVIEIEDILNRYVDATARIKIRKVLSNCI